MDLERSEFWFIVSIVISYVIIICSMVVLKNRNFIKWAKRKSSVHKQNGTLDPGNDIHRSSQNDVYLTKALNDNLAMMPKLTGRINVESWKITVVLTLKLLGLEEYIRGDNVKIEDKFTAIKVSFFLINSVS